MRSGAAKTMRNQAYASHRAELLAAGFPTAMLAVFVLTAAYQIVDFLYLPQAFGEKLLPNALQVLIPLMAILVLRERFLNNPEVIALVADLAFTAVMVGRLMLPATVPSGTALFLALKMIATAALFPWRISFQIISVSATLFLYCGAVAMSGRSLTAVYELAGPVIAAILSVLGALRSDETRFAFFRQNALLAESEERLRSLWKNEKTLVDVAREISAVTKLPTLLERINKLTASALACEFSAMFLLDEGRTELTPEATYADDEEVADRLRRFRGSLESPLVQELLRGQTVAINDSRAQGWLPAEELEAYDVHSIAFAPITAKGKVIGVLTAGRVRPSEPFDDRQLALLNGVAAQAGVAIDNAQLFNRLAASETRYRDLFEGANDLIFVVEEEGGFRFANRAARDFVAAAPDGIPSLRWQQFLPEASRHHLARRLQIAERRGFDSRRTFEVIVRSLPGVTATLELRVQQINQPGQPRLYQCIGRDITERKRQEVETLILLKKLTESNHLQTEFVANISHELRTPLNVIIGYTDLIADDPSLPIGGEARAFLNRIATAGRGLHRLVESVLEYARLDRGRNALLPSEFSGNQFVLELQALCNDVKSSPDVRMRFESTGQVQFSTDYDRLYSALSNLLLNALKFTPRGEILLELRSEAGMAEFIVRDTGIGIPATDLEHVFEPFRQVDGSATRTFGGVGLGLAIVRRNVQLLGGEIRVESEVEKGTTFTVRIPLVIDVAAPTARSINAA